MCGPKFIWGGRGQRDFVSRLTQCHLLNRISVFYSVVLVPWLKISLDHKCKGLFPDSQLSAIDTCFCPYASAPLHYCSFIVLFKMGKYAFQFCPFSKFFWLFCILCISIYVLGSAYSENKTKKSGILIDIVVNLHINLGRINNTELSKP